MLLSSSDDVIIIILSHLADKYGSNAPQRKTKLKLLGSALQCIGLSSSFSAAVLAVFIWVFHFSPHLFQALSEP